MGTCKNGANIKCAYSYSEIGGTGVKLNRPLSPQRRRKTRRKGLRQRYVDGQVAIERTVNEVQVI